MREGLYDSLLTARLREQLRAVAGISTQTHGLDEAEAPARLARFLADEVRRLLADLHGEERVEKQAAIVNELLEWLKARVEAETADTVASPAQVLLALHRTPEPPPRPLTPIGTSTLLIRPGKPDLGRELVAEVASADRVDALVSFVTWGGFRRLRTAFEEHARAGRQLRLLTTTYTGATEAAAVREIARLPGANVRVSFDGRRSRIHAKAWLFHRETGFSSVWVGSANLSASALAGGLEWTMKASEADMRHVADDLCAVPRSKPMKVRSHLSVERPRQQQDHEIALLQREPTGLDDRDVAAGRQVAPLERVVVDDVPQVEPTEIQQRVALGRRAVADGRAVGE